LKLYKDLTGIQWDYEATKHGIEGCILFLNIYINIYICIDTADKICWIWFCISY